MAPYVDSNTARGYIDYSSAGQRHTLQFRLGGTPLPADFIAFYNRVRPAMCAIMHTTDAVEGLRWSAQGQPFSFPLDVSPAPGTAVGTTDPDRAPVFVSIVGRSLDGVRVRITMFAAVFDLNGGYRAQVPSGTLAAWRTALIAPNPPATTVSGQVPVWNPYVNIGANAYYQRKARRTVG